MLFDSSLKQELNRSFGATLVVLVTVVMTMVLIRTLGLASSGTINPSEVSLVLGFTVLGFMPTIFTLSLFIAMVGTLSRMYRDSEMVIWMCSGQGVLRLIKPLMRFNLPMIAMVAMMLLVVWPWSNQQVQELRDRFERRGDLERVTPGQFQASASGQRVFFIEKELTTDVQGKNVFISITDADKTVIASASSGRIERIRDERFLVLKNGQRLERKTADGQLSLSEFETYSTRISAALVDPTQLAPNMQSVVALVTQPTPEHLAELGWRLGGILACFNFVLIAAMVSQYRPRAGRGFQLMLALFSFLVYTNFLNIGKSWVQDGRLTFWEYSLVFHGSIAVLSGLTLTVQHLQWSWRQWMPSSAKAGAAA